MKRKEGLYLPLLWCKNLKQQMIESIGSNIEPEELFDFANAIQVEDSDKASETIRKFCAKYPKFDGIAKSIFLLDKMGKASAQEMWNDTLKNMMSAANVMEWSMNKQVFKFDKDFLKELVRTENLVINKNAWDYLPFTSFYVDISENKELCKQLAGEGIFVTVRKLPAEKIVWQGEQTPPETAYEIHLCKVKKKYFYTDTLTVPNADYDCTLDGSEETNIDRHDVVTDKNGRIVRVKSEVKVNTKAYQTIIVQILNYLASVEPDIAENEETKLTYKPKPKKESKTSSGTAVKADTKDKYSEIRKWDVGVHFGTPYRRWKAEEQSGKKREANSKSTGKRPHSRKAHWSHYWYGSGNNKVRRPKWLNQMFINANKEETAGNPVTIHQCS